MFSGVQPALIFANREQNARGLCVPRGLPAGNVDRKHYNAVGLLLPSNPTLHGFDLYSAQMVYGTVDIEFA